MGDRVSFFVIAGSTADEIYAGYRLLTGPAPLLPKAAYGYIQCKQRYASQEELMAVAKGYRDRHLPADVLVVDWFYYTKMGQMDFDPKFWPDPAAMNKQLHDMGFETMISVWPRFVPDDRFYAELRKKGWFIHMADGTPIDGLPYDRAGSDIDTTNPEAAAWYWKTIRDNIISKGFDSLWADETEPDLPPNGAYFQIGPGTQYFNVYPLFHTAALYDGFRKDEPGRRALILSRDAYTGAQRNGTIVWSSDIYPTWDTLKRQIPTGLDCCGLRDSLLVERHRRLAISARGASPGPQAAARPLGRPRHGGRLRRLPGALHPLVPVRHLPAHLPHPRQPAGQRGLVLRQAGRADSGEVSAPALPADAVHLLARLPELADRRAHHARPAAGFPQRPKGGRHARRVHVRPGVSGGACHRAGGYQPPGLSAGRRRLVQLLDERADEGRPDHDRLRAHRHHSAVCAGRVDRSAGSPVESTHEKQAIEKVRVYPGADADFTLFSDDGQTYAYEKGAGSVTRLHWDEAGHRLTHEGAPAWTVPDSEIMEVAGH